MNDMESQVSDLSITIKVEDAKTKSTCEFQFRHSTHSIERSSQRGINSEKLSIALAYGQVYHKQGLIFYVLGESNIPDRLIKSREKLKNTVVVVDGDSGLILTCYRSKQPHKHLKKKTKIFKTYHNAA